MCIHCIRRLEGSPNIFTCYNFEDDSLNIQDKLSLVDELKQYHISGLKLGMKSLYCSYIENYICCYDFQ